MKHMVEKEEVENFGYYLKGGILLPNQFVPGILSILSPYNCDS